MKKFILTLVFLFACHQAASACQCQFSDNRFNEAKAVFYGRVLSKTRNFDTRQEIIKVKTERIFKGDATGVITILSSYNCPYNFQVGKRYLIYAGDGENDLLRTGPCRILYDKIARQEMKYLGKGTLSKIK
jgi:hypothetical protein